MDLGFGNENQTVGSVAANALLQGAKAQEETVEAELARFDRLLDDDEGLEQLRQQRMVQMQKKHSQQKKWRDLGHGTYEELGGGQDSRDVARDFFQASKATERLVVHFYRPSTRLCDVFHAHLAKLAPKHMETKFVKVNVEDCDHQGGGASYLVEKLGIVVMPTLLLVKDRKAIHHIRGFDELGDTDEFSTNALGYVLGQYGVLDPRDDEEVPENVFKMEGINSIRINKGARRGYGYGGDEFD